MRVFSVKSVVVAGLFLGLVFTAKAFFSKDELIKGNEAGKKRVSIVDDGMFFEAQTEAKKVEDFLAEQGIWIDQDDQVIPSMDAAIFHNSKMIILRSKKIIVDDGGKEEEYKTTFLDMRSFFLENNIRLAEFDVIKPDVSTPISDEMKIKITRVVVKEEVETEAIDFKKTAKEDDEMGWREEKILQKGEKGSKEVKYEVVYYNDKEVSRKAKESSVVKEPVEQITKKGTYVKVGKAHSGLASWYAQPSHLKAAFPSITGYYAANPWLPKGSYVKVTNKNNGKVIMARINDRGPFGPGRIIDLDKAAFSAIANLYVDGVVDVKMEEILN